MTYKSDVLEAVHEAAADLHEIGLVDKKTMRRFDESCLTTIEKLTPQEIRLSEKANTPARRSLRGI